MNKGQESETTGQSSKTEDGGINPLLDVKFVADGKATYECGTWTVIAEVKDGKNIVVLGGKSFEMKPEDYIEYTDEEGNCYWARTFLTTI